MRHTHATEGLVAAFAATARARYAELSGETGIVRRVFKNCARLYMVLISSEPVLGYADGTKTLLPSDGNSKGKKGKGVKKK